MDDGCMGPTRWYLFLYPIGRKPRLRIFTPSRPPQVYASRVAEKYELETSHATVAPTNNVFK